MKLRTLIRCTTGVVGSQLVRLVACLAILIHQTSRYVVRSQRPSNGFAARSYSRVFTIRHVDMQTCSIREMRSRPNVHTWTGAGLDMLSCAQIGATRWPQLDESAPAQVLMWA